MTVLSDELDMSTKKETDPSHRRISQIRSNIPPFRPFFEIPLYTTQTAISSNRRALFGMTLRHDLLGGLTGVLNIFLNINSILDAEKDERGGNDKGATEKSPVADELIHVRSLIPIQAPHDGCAG